MANLDPKLFDGIKRILRDVFILTAVNHDEVKKVAKKLRLRNYPSLALFHDGSKKKESMESRYGWSCRC